jgi:hypothetical protein
VRYLRARYVLTPRTAPLASHRKALTGRLFHALQIMGPPQGHQDAQGYIGMVRPLAASLL